MAARSTRGPQLPLNQISRWEVAGGPTALGRLWRTLHQVNVVGAGRIKLKPVDIGTLERLRGCANRGRLRRRR